LGLSRRTVISSINRRRKGLIALSVIGGSYLEGGSRPLNLKAGRGFRYSTGCYFVALSGCSPSSTEPVQSHPDTTLALLIPPPGTAPGWRTTMCGNRTPHGKNIVSEDRDVS